MIAAEDYEAALQAHLKASGTSGADLGMEFEHGPRKVVMHLAQHRLASHRPMFSSEIRNEDTLRHAKRYLSETLNARQWFNAILAAHGFLYGSDDGVQRPYMVESAIVRLFTLRGMDMERLRTVLVTEHRRFGGNPWLDKTTKTMIERVWATFEPYDKPAQFQEWCWRDGTRRTPHDFDIGTDIQFRLVGKKGWGLMPYVEMAPGIMWIGGPCPQIWIRDTDFPTAIMNAAKGRALTDIVGIDEFDVPGLKVLNMRHDGKRTVVMVNAPKEDATAIADGIRESRRPAKAA